MPKSDVDPVLYSYLWFGLDLSPARANPAEQTGDCPMCGTRSFSLHTEKQRWQCWKCGGGNLTTFMRLLHEHSLTSASDEEYEALAEDRKLMAGDSLKLWGVVKSSLTGEWLIPGYNHEGKLTQLYRYAPNGMGKMVLMPPPFGTLRDPDTDGHGLFGLKLRDPEKPDVYICEGVWDGIALWEVMRKSSLKDGKFVLTGNDSASLIATANVIATPGANVFNPRWSQLLSGKNVYLLYDSDHPKEVNGVRHDPNGYAGMRRVAGILADADEQPKEVYYLSWGTAGYDPDRPHGWDVRDHLAQDESTKGRIALLPALFSMLAPIPPAWAQLGAKKGQAKIEPLPCDDWKTVRDAWRRCMRWTPEYDLVLSVMLSVVTSTKQQGDQLWLRVIGPAGSGKTTLADGLTVSKHVKQLSNFTGFHSGYKTDKEGDEDHSLLAKMRDKTGIIKDADLLLQSDYKNRIMAQLREIYDRNTKSDYANAINREYNNLNMTLIISGTTSLRAIDKSELGERFLTVQTMREIDDELEDEATRRKAYTASRDVALESNGRPDSQRGADETKALQLTGGYVDYLRGHARYLLAQVLMDDPELTMCQRLAKFTSHMRARPSTMQEETAEREFATRLTSQYVRLAKCLAVVLNRGEVDAEVMRRVRLVAMDTSEGKVLQITKRLYAVGEYGLDSKNLSLLTGGGEEKETTLLKFMARIKIVEPYQPKGYGKKVRWRLTPRMRKLYREVMPDAA